MTTEQFESRLAVLERGLADVQRQLAAAGNVRAKKGVLALAGSMADFPEFDRVMEHVHRRKLEEIVTLDRNGTDP